MRFGYIRVSKDDQNHELQIDALNREGCDRVFTDKVSGSATVKPEQDKLIEQLRPGDEVIVWDIDRLGRSTVGLLLLVDGWNKQGIKFKSTSQPLIDTTTEAGDLMFKLFAVLAEHERRRLIRRTQAGLSAARARGRTGGRPRGLITRYKKIMPMVYDAHKAGKSIRAIREAFNIPSNATVYKIIGVAKAQEVKSQL